MGWQCAMGPDIGQWELVMGGGINCFKINTKEKDENDKVDINGPQEQTWCNVN